MSSTTTAPAEAGTAYPMPPKPGWATSTRLEKSTLFHDCLVGSFCDIGALNGQPNHDVELSRADVIETDRIEVFDVLIRFGEIELFAAGARRLAALLVQAADLAEQS